MSGATNKMVEELRREFDDAFAAPLAVAVDNREGVIVGRAGEERLVLRVAELRGVMRCPAITRLPSLAPQLLGVAAVRGNLIGMYDLAALITNAVPSKPGRWACLCADEAVGLVFDELQGYERLATPAIRRAPAAGVAPASPKRVVEIGGVSHAVVDVAALLKRIRDLALRSGVEQE